MMLRWCGTDCTGSVYFYELGIVAGVEGEFSGTTSSFTITVDSTHSGSISSGATNTIGATCTTPLGTGTDSNVVIRFAP